EGPVTLCAGDGLAAHWIAPHLPDFHLQNPKIELRLVTTDRPDTDLLNDKADIAVQFQEPGGRQDIVSKRLGILHYIFWASPDYVRTFGHPTSVFDLHEHRCIIHSGYVNQMERWAPKAKQFRDLIDFALVTNSGSVMLEVCANGGGIALMPTYVHDLQKNLVPLNLPEVAPIRFWLTYPERVRRLARAQIVIDWLRGLFNQRLTPWFKPNFVHPKSMDKDRDRLRPENSALTTPPVA
ncbi:MAG: LysR substrate-binding domain-containing protein, partial [Pseudomonadota bacterium]